MESRRDFIKKTSIAMGAATTSPLLAGDFKKDKFKSGFIHMVFFWLKDTSDAAVTDFIRVTREFVDQVEEVNAYRVGRPAPTNRDVVENTYAVSLVVEFDSMQEHDIYQAHQAHLDYIKNYQDRWETVRVFDAIS